MGGLIAHYFAVRNPEKNQRLVLVGTAPTAANSAIVGGTVMDEINRADRPDRPGLRPDVPGRTDPLAGSRD